jgi:hypothetical protein
VRRTRSTAAISLSFFFWLCTAALASEPGEHPDLILNGGFEEGDLAPIGWRTDAYLFAGVAFAWDSSQSYQGSRSIKISAPTANDARWLQTVAVEPDTNYLLSGWVRTVGVTDTLELVNAGANLGIFDLFGSSGAFEHSAGVFGTKDWTYVSMVFNSGSRTQVQIGARLGFYAGTATGTAWFDDLRLTPILPTDPHPAWKILVLIYRGIDLRYSDASGAHHITGTMSAAEQQLAADAARRFVLRDIPLLTSGNMIPTVTVRFPARALAGQIPYGGSWWPDPASTAPERDPAFDSVLVLWNPNGVDQSTGQPVSIGGAAGLTLPTGTDQTYATMRANTVTAGHLNVLKHEWGHSLLFFYQALGTAPQPTVSNHATPTEYVNCRTGKLYVWLDELENQPIPNSIYNNDSGFTHDYYSGTTALASQPDHCLGITPAAWATGGPVSRPQRPEALTPLQQIGAIRASVEELVAQAALARGTGKALQAKLDAAARALARGQEKTAAQVLRAFINQVKAIVKSGRLDADAGLALMESAQEVIDRLQPV